MVAAPAVDRLAAGECQQHDEPAARRGGKLVQEFATGRLVGVEEAVAAAEGDAHLAFAYGDDALLPGFGLTGRACGGEDGPAQREDPRPAAGARHHPFPRRAIRRRCRRTAAVAPRCPGCGRGAPRRPARPPSSPRPAAPRPARNRTEENTTQPP